MRVLIAPVGMQDPHGRADPATGDRTEGSVLRIARTVCPDKVILLPTDTPDGTVPNAEETRDWLVAEELCADVVICPVNMVQPNDYEEAVAAYGAVLREVCSSSDAEYCVNTSSGTPAIKSACMLAIADGTIQAEAWYADDPTKSTRPDPVRRLDVSFLRRSALRQRIAGLLEQGHFWTAREACAELERATLDARSREAAAGWRVWLTGLQAWDERHYEEAKRQIIEARKNLSLQERTEWSALLREGLDCVSRHSQPGWVAWDIYHMADRLALQGRHAMALEWAWVAIEASVAQEISTSREDGRNFVRRLRAIERPEVVAFFDQSFRGTDAEKTMGKLWRRRCDCVHNGKTATAADAERVLDVARVWLQDVIGGAFSNSPLSASSLGRLANAFRVGWNA